MSEGVAVWRAAQPGRPNGPLGGALLTLALGLAACGGSAGDGTPSAANDSAGDAPSVLLLTLDTTRADALGPFGGPPGLTPAVDELARESLCFLNARTVAPLTMPAHASLFTGLYPPRHAVRDNNVHVLPEAAETLAERARERGYRTAAFVSSVAVDRAFGFAQGFDHYDQPERAHDQSGGSHSEARNGSQVARAAAEWFAGRDRSRPFFAWVHFWDPHAPYAPPAAYRERAGGDAYHGEVAAMDSALGALFEVMRRSEAWENTLIVMVADHGEALGERGEPTHGTYCFDNTIRVPLLVRFPDQRQAGETSKAVVSVVDVFPTVLEALGWGPSGDVDGVSLLQPRESRSVYFESFTGYLYYGWSPLVGWADERGVYLDSSRPLYYPAGTEFEEEGRPPTSLEAEEVRQRLIELFARPALEATTTGSDEELLGALRDLGYTASGAAPTELPDPWDERHRPSPIERLEEHRRTIETINRYNRDQDDEALVALQELLDQNPNNVKVLAHICTALLARERFQEAAEHLQRLLAIGPAAAGVYYNLGYAHERLEEPEAAIAAYRRTLELDRGHRAAIEALSNLLEAQGEVEEAQRLRAGRPESD